MTGLLHRGYVTASLLGAGWTVTIAVTVTVAMSLVTGDAFRPSVGFSVIFGAALGAVLRAGCRKSDIG